MINSTRLAGSKRKLAPVEKALGGCRKREWEKKNLHGLVVKWRVRNQISKTMFKLQIKFDKPDVIKMICVIDTCCVCSLGCLQFRLLDMLNWAAFRFTIKRELTCELYLFIWFSVIGPTLRIIIIIIIFRCNVRTWED